MRLRDLRTVGHAPSLVAALIHFEVSFACWVLLGVLAPFIARDVHLGPAMKGFVVATPLLGGAVWRIAVGALSDAKGPRRVGTATMLAALLPLGAAWLLPPSPVGLLATGLFLGIAGSSFAVAIPLAAAHYPATHRGLALGVAGAGNSGTILAALIAPRIAAHVGWQATFGLALFPVAAAAIAFRLLAREAPRPPDAHAQGVLAALTEPGCWRLCALYAVTFGGFVGLASYAPTFFVDRFAVTPVAAATLAAAAAGAGSIARPFGGLFADRAGGARVLGVVYVVVALLSLGLGASPSRAATAVILTALLGTLGVGNGAVFQLVAERFPGSIGSVSGIVGAAGGIGGFILPAALSISRGATGSFAAGFVVFAVAAAIAPTAIGPAPRSAASVPGRERAA